MSSYLPLSHCDGVYVTHRLKVDRRVPEVAWCVPGESAALAALQAFTLRLGKYSAERNDPSLPGERCSGVSNECSLAQLRPVIDILACARSCLPTSTSASWHRSEPRLSFPR